MLLKQQKHFSNLYAYNLVFVPLVLLYFNTVLLSFVCCERYIHSIYIHVCLDMLSCTNRLLDLAQTNPCTATRCPYSAVDCFHNKGQNAISVNNKSSSDVQKASVWKPPVFFLPLKLKCKQWPYLPSERPRPFVNICTSSKPVWHGILRRSDTFPSSTLNM